MSEATNERAGKGRERNNEWEIRFKRKRYNWDSKQ